MTWSDEERAAELVNRLRGIYNIPIRDGHGPLDGSDTFTQKFNTPEIQQRAADYIDKLEGYQPVDSEKITALIAELRAPGHHMRLPDPYCPPINLEAADRLEYLTTQE